MMIRSGTQHLAGTWDWLAYAVEKLGGPTKAAQAIGISRNTLYSYLAEGLGSAPFRRVVLISELADVPLEYLRRRLGPYDDEVAAVAGIQQ